MILDPCACIRHERSGGENVLAARRMNCQADKVMDVHTERARDARRRGHPSDRYAFARDWSCLADLCAAFGNNARAAGGAGAAAIAGRRRCVVPEPARQPIPLPLELQWTH